VNRPPLLALARTEASGEIALCAPQVGVWSDPPAPGLVLGPGSSLGALTQLGRRRALVVPEGVEGVIEGDPPRQRARAVGYADVLVRVRPGAAAARKAASGRAASGDAEGLHRILAPTDGVFYAAAAPGSPRLAPIGARLQVGQTVGLIEVMKTFHPILYGGASLPESAEVVEVLAADGEEVRAGQGLFVLR